MIRQNDEVRQWFIGRGRRGSGSAPHRRRLAPLVESLEERALLAALAAPSNLAGTALTPHQVSLTWTESSRYSYFQIQRSTDGVNFSPTPPLRSNTTSYVATGLDPSTSYSFRVRAANAGSFSNWTVVTGVRTPASVVAPYSDDFDALNTNDQDPLALGSAWTYTTSGDWSYIQPSGNGGNGVLEQTGTGDTNGERKALLTGLAGTPNEIIAQVRVDSWFEGELAREGVGLYTDPKTGQGYSLVFTGRWYDGTVHLEFVNDQVAWSGWPTQGGVSVTYPMVTGTSYWFRMDVSAGVLYGKVWEVGTVEPSAWTITYNPAPYPTHWNRTGGVAALTGSDAGTFQRPDGTIETRSYATASFDNVTVRTGVTVPTTVMTSASASTSAVALVAPGAGPMDDSTLTDLAGEFLRSRRKH